jgi:tRNA dimethylallyltransferase
VAASERTTLPVLALLGPTGVGKTAVAVALARRLPIEVVSVDSRQVYRHMDVGTGKPTAAERQAVRHHLVDVVEPDAVYDASRFARDAAGAIADIHRRGRWPVLVGGTGLYFRALVRGLLPRPPADPALRRRLQGEAAAEGAEALHGRLRSLDPETAGRLNPRDLVRIIRALEVVLLTGAPLARGGPGAWGVPAPGPGRHRVLAVGLTRDRPALYAALDARVDRMLAEGLLPEVARLLAMGFAPGLPSMQGIGYRQLVPVLQGRAILASAVHATKRDTRRYAKRQWTWFQREAVTAWLDAGAGAVALAEEIARIVERTRLFD